MKLTDLRDNPGAAKRKKRVGRGPGSGLGKMGGRGIKGQKSRSGVAIKGFEGGQMPLYQRLPKRGFRNIFRKHYAIINLMTLETAMNDGKFTADEVVTEQLLLERGIVRRLRDGVRLLGRGEISAALKIEVTGASASAIEAVKAKGGSVTLIAPAEEPAAAAS